MKQMKKHEKGCKQNVCKLWKHAGYVIAPELERVRASAELVYLE